MQNSKGFMLLTVHWIEFTNNILLAGWTHVREIPNTKLLVSLSHSFFTSANMEIFDISKKTPRKIYSFEEVFGSKAVSS